MDSATFYTVADASYFLAVVALVNSLRACGHRERIVVLDAGLTRQQSELLQHECELVALTAAGAANPTYYKLVAPRSRPDEVIALIDADMIVTGNLGELCDAAREGKVVAYPDPEADRWYAEWEAIFGLPARPRHQTYVNAGLVLFTVRSFPTLLDEWWSACQKTRHLPTIAEGAVGPASQADQDALNALLMSRYPQGAVHLRPAREAPQRSELEEGGVRVDDRRSLRCSDRGHRTLVLHCAGRIKPWQTDWEIRNTVYVHLLRDLLDSEDRPLRVPREMIPLWLRRSGRGRLALTYGLVRSRYRRTRRRVGRLLRRIGRD